MEQKFKNGDLVYWTDHEHKTSGKYTIVKQGLQEEDEQPIWIITNGYLEIEVFEDEIKLL